ncbi:glycosyltransferase family 4 protein [Butyrivibrio sp. MC2013]|uniref:glycosyltransferase family 4 protein n=1 Tax=Butyrivibrio sp. MC2013 TaxID=1280686 RepID=UPI000409101B|nr:glycosyltransferase family 4 protein [Butyrivibrio sp. MC2013]
MKILIVNKFLYPNGGSETYIFKIGQALSAMGHEVQYFGMAHEGNIVGNNAGIYTEDMSFTGRGSKLKKLTYPFKIIYSFDARRKILRLLEDMKPDVVHLNNINFQLTPSIIDEIRAWEKDSGRRVRIVSTAHDSMWVCPGHLMKVPSTGELCQRCIDGKVMNCTKYRCIHDSRLQSFLASLEAILYRKKGTYRQVDKVICPSAFMNDVLSHNPDLKGRCVTLHNFIDESGADTGTDMLDDKVSVILQRKSPYVLFFGRYSWEKGIGTLVSVCRSLPEIDFVFAGNGDLEDEVNSCSNITNVGFQGAVSLTELIKGALFTVFPSEVYENCPFSVMESQLAGTPVLASRLGGIPELIDEGVTGELFTASDPDELTDKIYRLWNNEALVKTYSDNCLAIGRGEGRLKVYSLGEYCRRLIDIYSE